MVSIPTNCFRRFDVVGNEYGFLFAFLGKDAGGITWHPQVIEEAKSHGLFLLENGRLVDSVAGHLMPDDMGVMPPLSEKQLTAFDNYSVAPNAFTCRQESKLSSNF